MFYSYETFRKLDAMVDRLDDAGVSRERAVDLLHDLIRSAVSDHIEGRVPQDASPRTGFPAGIEPDPVTEPDPVILAFTSPDVPKGWDTVLGYLARYHPEALELIDDDYVEGTQRDGFKLTHWCKLEGIEPIKVRAPQVLRDEGILTVNAYPERLLARRMG